jgi:ABC-type sulfate/molybdate transport systems ATPase subunit
VFHNCILTALAGKTRVLVTNQLQLLRHCDKVLMLEKGKVAHLGSFEALTARKSSELTRTLLAYGGVASESSGALDTLVEAEAPAVKEAPLQTDAKLGKLITKETKHEGQVSCTPRLSRTEQVGHGEPWEGGLVWRSSKLSTKLFVCSSQGPSISPHRLSG